MISTIYTGGEGEMEPTKYASKPKENGQNIVNLLIRILFNH